MATLLQLVSDAMTNMGELGQGQSANAEEGARGLRAANRILQSAQTDRLMQHYVRERAHQLAAGTASYTMGTGGAIDVPRPVFIEGAEVEFRDGGDGFIKNTCSILDKAKWDAIRDRGARASAPIDVYPEYGPEFITIKIHPIPTGFNGIMPYLLLGCWEALQLFEDLDDDLELPAEYEKWLEWELTVALAPGFQKAVHQDWIRERDEARAAVMSKNAQSMGGALGESRTLESPNVGKPIPQR